MYVLCCIIPYVIYVLLALVHLSDSHIHIMHRDSKSLEA